MYDSGTFSADSSPYYTPAKFRLSYGYGGSDIESERVCISFAVGPDNVVPPVYFFPKEEILKLADAIRELDATTTSE